jgi:uncharacterized protein
MKRTTKARNAHTVQRIYEAFNRGDVPAILERLAEDVRWEHHPKGNTAQDQDIPYMRRRHGRDEVAAYFSEVEEDLEIHSWNPLAFLEGDERVAVMFEIDCTVRSTGKQIRDEQIHLWQFGADGKVSALRHFLDTAKAIEAHS